MPYKRLFIEYIADRHSIFPIIYLETVLIEKVLQRSVSYTRIILMHQPKAARSFAKYKSPQKYYTRNDCMEKIQLIVECAMDEEKEKLIERLGEVKYSLPMINSYVIEIQKSDLNKLSGIEGIKAIHQNAHITAQMNVARKIVKAESAQSNGYTGRGIGIAILDTGVDTVGDLVRPKNRISAFANFAGKNQNPHDDNGHGTHVRLRRA